MILLLSTAADGTVSFPIQNAATGLRIEVDAGDGHSDYRILTPADLAGERLTD
jgi:nickel transport protein